MKKLFIIFLAGVPLFAAEPSAINRGTRALGMGGAMTAIADDQNVFFYNPAGTVQRTGSLLNVMDVSLTASKDAVDFFQYVDDNKDKLKKFDSLDANEKTNLINEINSKMVRLKPTFGASLPNMAYLSGPVGKSLFWGAGLFGQVNGRAGFLPVITVPDLYYDITVDVMPAANVAYRFGVPGVPGRWGLGANVKYIRRGRIEEPGVSVAVLDDYDTPPLQKGKGWGMDLGTLYQPSPRWNVGLSVSDFGGTTIKYDPLQAEKGYSAKAAHDEEIKAQWNVGFGWTPGRIGLPSFGIPLHDRLVLAGDVRDFANKESKVFADGGLADTAGTHFHLGAEYRWLFLRLRAGANQGYFTGGAGIDWPLIKLDYAYYADELSPFAGVSRHPAHRVSFSFGFGSGNTTARKRIKDSYATEKETPAVASPQPQSGEPPAVK